MSVSHKSTKNRRKKSRKHTDTHGENMLAIFALKCHACYSQNMNAVLLNSLDGKGYPEAHSYLQTERPSTKLNLSEKVNEVANKRHRNAYFPKFILAFGFLFQWIFSTLNSGSWTACYPLFMRCCSHCSIQRDINFIIVAMASCCARKCILRFLYSFTHR